MRIFSSVIFNKTISYNGAEAQFTYLNGKELHDEEIFIKRIDEKLSIFENLKKINFLDESHFTDLSENQGLPFEISKVKDITIQKEFLARYNDLSEPKSDTSQRSVAYPPQGYTPPASPSSINSLRFDDRKNLKYHEAPEFLGFRHHNPSNAFYRRFSSPARLSSVPDISDSFKNRKRSGSDQPKIPPKASNNNSGRRKSWQHLQRCSSLGDLKNISSPNFGEFKTKEFYSGCEINFDENSGVHELSISMQLKNRVEHSLKFKLPTIDTVNSSPIIISMDDLLEINHNSLQFAKYHNIYRGKAMIELEGTNVAGLCFVVYPGQTKENLQDLSNWITALFACDDLFDARKSGEDTIEFVKSMVDRKVELICALERIYRDSDDTEVQINYTELFKDTDTTEMKALVCAANSIIKKTHSFDIIYGRKNSNSQTQLFCDTTCEYLKSVVSEKEQEGQGGERVLCTTIRNYASGAVHAIKIGLWINGGTFPVNEFDIQRTLTDTTAQQIQLVNDILSFQKEYIQFLKENNEKNIIDFINEFGFNRVAINAKLILKESSHEVTESNIHYVLIKALDQTLNQVNELTTESICRVAKDKIKEYSDEIKKIENEMNSQRESSGSDEGDAQNRSRLIYLTDNIKLLNDYIAWARLQIIWASFCSRYNRSGMRTEEATSNIFKHVESFYKKEKQSNVELVSGSVNLRLRNYTEDNCEATTQKGNSDSSCTVKIAEG